MSEHRCMSGTLRDTFSNHDFVCWSEGGVLYFCVSIDPASSSSDRSHSPQKNIKTNKVDDDERVIDVKKPR